MKKQQSLSLTTGSIFGGILAFTCPLIIGNLFQQLYNTTDSFIVGNFVGSNALAAIGASAQIINLFIGFIIGLTTGSGIVIAQYYGASDIRHLHVAIHTSFWFCTLGGILVSIAGYLCSPLILQLMNTPAEVVPDAALYLRIYFLGAFFNILYNMGAGTLQAIGDTRRPLYYLFVSSLTNVILDIVFVVCFHWDIMGVGLATLIAQLVSAFLVLYRLTHTDDIYRLNLKEIRCYKDMMFKILRFGIPTGLQSAITSLSNVVVQGYLNGFGAAAMAGSNIYTKMDMFALLPINCLSITTTTYMAQNIGAKKADRIKKGFRTFLLAGNLYTVLIGVLLFFFSEVPLSLFTSDQDVIHYGILMGKVLGPSYFLLNTCNVFIGVSRGAGDTLSTMLISILSLCGVRVLWLMIMIPHFPSIYTLYLGYPITWALASLGIAIYYKKITWPRVSQSL